MHGNTLVPLQHRKSCQSGISSERVHVLCLVAVIEKIRQTPHQNIGTKHYLKLVSPFVQPQNQENSPALVFQWRNTFASLQRWKPVRLQALSVCEAHTAVDDMLNKECSCYWWKEESVQTNCDTSARSNPPLGTQDIIRMLWATMVFHCCPATMSSHGLEFIVVIRAWPILDVWDMRRILSD